MEGRTFLVAGGAGNVAGFVVRSLLRRGARVAVPSRSTERLEALAAAVTNELGRDCAKRLLTITGNIGDESDAPGIVDRTEEELGPLGGGIAALGGWGETTSLLSAEAGELEAVLSGNLLAHFVTAKTVLSRIKDRRSAYVFINGPGALRPVGRAPFISVSTAAQQMLFRAFASELDAAPVRINEAMIYAFIRNGETQPGSPLSGEMMGEVLCRLLGRPMVPHGEMVELRSDEEVRSMTDAWAR